MAPLQPPLARGTREGRPRPRARQDQHEVKYTSEVKQNVEPDLTVRRIHGKVDLTHKNNLLKSSKHTHLPLCKTMCHLITSTKRPNN